MSKKLQITVSDDIYEWLSKEAENKAVRPVTLVSMYVGEARKRQKDQENLQLVFDKMKTMTEDQWKNVLSVNPNEKK